MATGKPKNNPYQMFCYATAYWKSSASLDREPNRLPYQLPSIILQLLGFEVYLKCLLCIRGKIRRGHDLQKLFDELDAADQQALHTAFHNHTKSKPAMKGVTLQSVFDRSKDVFEKARYGYEGFVWPSDSTGDQGNRGLPDALHAVRAVIGRHECEFALKCRVDFGLEPPK